jgi:hypothetical protein
MSIRIMIDNCDQIENLKYDKYSLHRIADLVNNSLVNIIINQINRFNRFLN